MGFGILILYLFLIYSRIFDVKLSFLHIPGISYRVILAMVVLSQAFIVALKSNVGKALLAFTVWLVLAIPFSIWRRGSIEMLLSGWFPAFVVFLATAGLIGGYDQCRRAVYAVAYGLFVLTMIAMVWGSTETGRLFLPYGKFSNPNEMAQALLLGLPLWWLILLNAKSALMKAVAVTAMLAMLLTTAKTGSRGALIGLAVLIAIVFLRSSMAGKLKMIVFGAALALLIIGTMPKRLLNRYQTFADEQDAVNPDDWIESNAIASTNARKDLLKKSIKYTLQHPLFGVGPGMFTVAENAEAQALGKRHGTWQGTHNSYTQVSSEEGIPAFIAYTLALVFALGNTARIYRKTRGDPRLQDISNLSVCLNYALIVFAVTIFFDYIAYSSMLPVFGGLAAALARTAEVEIQRRMSATKKEVRPDSRPWPRNIVLVPKSFNARSTSS